MSFQLHLNFTYRTYQIEAINAIFDYFETNSTGHCLIAAPTGVGKALIIAGFICEVMRRYPGQRILQLVHSKELVEQNHKTLKRVWPNSYSSVYCAGLYCKDTIQSVIFGSLGSVRNNIEAFGWRDLIILDEAHTLSPDEATGYQKIIASLTKINPNIRVVGLSATVFRLGQGLLTDNGFFTDVCFDITGLAAFNRLIAEGWLSPLIIPSQIKNQLDITGIAISKGDFNQGQLQKAVDKQEVTEAAIKEAIEHGYDRNCWLVFASGIEHSEHVASTLQSYGISAAAVHSKITDEERDERILAFKTGKLKALVGFRVMTTGFDHPPIDLIIDLYPTVSPGMHVQKMGRGTRPYDGSDPNFPYVKRNCVAEGELVLTDKGLVPIEKITLDMRLWDGCTWVKHYGTIFQGQQEVISYAGITATPDHKMWTEKGWKTLWECRAKQIPISQTGIAERALREADGHFIRDISSRKAQQTVFKSSVRLRPTSSERLQQRSGRKGRLPHMWAPSKSSEMVKQQNYFSKATLHKSKRSGLSSLRWEGCRVSFQFNNRNGSLYSRTFGVGPKQAGGPNRQRWSLRTWKFTIINSRTKFSTYSKGNEECFYSRLSRTTPRRKICRQYVENSILEGNDLSRNKRQILQTGLEKTKRGVWDILNAGPLHRFTVSNLLVSNCLVLDFSNNTRRNGPINDPCIPKRKGDKTGDAPIKICEVCGLYNHASARHCGGKPYPSDEGCGAEFFFKTKLVRTAGTDVLIAGTEVEEIIEEFPVTRVIYHKHNKIGSKSSMKVSYYCGLQRFTEYVCLEHSGMAKTRAKNWWRQRHASEPPETVDEALFYSSQLRCPKRISVVTSSKYPEIKSIEW